MERTGGMRRPISEEGLHNGEEEESNEVFWAMKRTNRGSDTVE